MKKILLSLALLCLGFYAMAQDATKVLFIGNSYTEVNNLPQLVKSVAESARFDVSVMANTPGGCTFRQHCTNQSMDLIRQGGWDFVVLQEQSQYPAFPQNQVDNEVFPYAWELAKAVKNVGARPMFYMTWGRKDGDQQNGQIFPPIATYEGMDSLLYERYMYMATTNEASVCPVGRVWRYIRENHHSIELYQADGSHPSMAGSYAAACAFFVMIFHQPTDLITYDAGLDSATAQIIRNVVNDIVYDHYDLWYDPANYDPNEGGDDPLAISDADAALSRIYPNPATSQAAIEGHFEILDAMGRILISGTDRADLSSLPQGVYIVRRPGATERLIKQ